MLQINIEGYADLVLTYRDHNKFCLVLLLFINPIITKMFYLLTAFKTLFENEINNKYSVLLERRRESYRRSLSN